MKATLLLAASLALASSCLNGCGFAGSTEDKVVDGWSEVPEDAGARDALGDRGTGQDGATYGDAITAPTTDDHCTPCMTDADCKPDEVFCNGREYCTSMVQNLAGQSCCQVEPACGAPGDPCSEFACFEELHQCVEKPLDADRDGFPAASVGGKACPRGTDCDDADFAIHPGAREECDGEDNDCNGTADDGAWRLAGSPATASAAGSDVLSAALGWDSEGWVAAWSERSGAAGRLCAMRYREAELRAGTVAPPGAGRCVSTAAPADQVGLALWGGGAGFVIWVERNMTIKARRLDFSGSGSFAAVPEAILLPGRAPDTLFELDVVADGESPGSAALFYRADSGDDFEIFMLEVAFPTAPSGTGLKGEEPPVPVRVTGAEGFSGEPSAVRVAGGWVAAWVDDRAGNKEIYFAAIGEAAADGGGPFAAVRVTDTPGDSVAPVLLEAAGGYRVAWLDESGGGVPGLAAVSIDKEGAALGGKVTAEATGVVTLYFDGAGEGRPAPAPDQDLVVYSTFSGGRYRLSLTAVGVGTAAIPPGALIYDGPSPVKAPLLAGGEAAKAVLWIEGDSPGARLRLGLLACE